MKIGVISDTHIPDRCAHIPKSILNAFKHVDMIAHAGDMVSLEALEELKSSCPKIVAVAGNMDSQAIIRKFPSKHIFEIFGLKIGLIHGCPAGTNTLKALKNAFKDSRPEIIIFGHTHKPMNETIEGTLFFNPGSATDLSLDYASYGIIEINLSKKNKTLAENTQNYKITAKIIKV